MWEVEQERLTAEEDKRKTAVLVEAKRQIDALEAVRLAAGKTQRDMRLEIDKRIRKKICLKCGRPLTVFERFGSRQNHIGCD